MFLRMLSLAILFSFKVISADALFHRQTLETLAQPFNEECFRPQENADLYYLNVSIKIFNKANKELTKMIPPYLFPFLKGLRQRGSLTSEKFTIINHGDGIYTIGNDRQLIAARNIDQVREALDRRHWFTITNTLSDIAKMKFKTLIGSKKKKDIKIAKALITSPKTDDALRTKFVDAIIEYGDRELMDWLLMQTGISIEDMKRLLDRLVG